MKTPLQELIEKLKVEIQRKSSSKDDAAQYYCNGLSNSITWAEKLLPKEKEVIINAADNWIDAEPMPGEQYFTKTFNND